ncbi:MAG: hypothetical protein ABIQ24_07250 [Nitrospiraceae bacterium]
MVPAILPEVETAIMTLDPWNEFSHEVVAEPISDGGAIVIRISLDGNCSVQILAESSTEEEELRERLTAARPILELFQAGVRAE